MAAGLVLLARQRHAKAPLTTWLDGAIGQRARRPLRARTLLIVAGAWQGAAALPRRDELDARRFTVPMSFSALAVGLTGRRTHSGQSRGSVRGR